MSIGSALSNAYSGLLATSRMADIVSSNVANALNENYARRSVELIADSIGGNGAGVIIGSVTRLENAATTSTRRAADAKASYSSALDAAYKRLVSSYGQVGDGDSLHSKSVRLETAIVAAVANPESSSTLSNLAAQARSIAAKIVEVAQSNQKIRMDADAKIYELVGTLNDSLSKIENLNREIRTQSSAGGDSSALFDQRQKLIDDIARIIPIKVIKRPGDQLSIFSNNGAQLLDGKAATLGFEKSGLITSDMAIVNGSLSGISLNGSAIEIGYADGLLDGGILSAMFEIRDTVLPKASTALDAFAADLIARTQTAAVDPSIASGLPGMFTDNGSEFISANTDGVSDRIAVNILIDPAQGGSADLVRDGIYFPSSGGVADSAILNNLLAAMREYRVPPVGSGTSSALDSSELVSEIVSANASAAFRAEENASYELAHASVFKENELAATGVNTDYEMQNLILIEQAYAANARVISVIDNMLRTLMEM